MKLPSSAVRSARVLTLGLCVALLTAAPIPADVVHMRNGADVEGRLESVDAEDVFVRTADGRLRRLDRSSVRSIEFTDSPRARVPFDVEIRNVRSDDMLDVFLNDEEVIEKARGPGEWIRVTDRIKTGNNKLTLRMHNERAGWSYHLALKVNGRVTQLKCGVPDRPDRACRCCGMKGTETGQFELPPIWIHADRELGTAEIIP